MKAIETSIITATIKAFSKVPIPGFWLKNIQKNKTAKLIKSVTVPIEKSTFSEIPCARTVQGEAPVNETINNPSPNPNNVRPKHKKKKVEIFGLKFRGLLELHETLGIFFKDKNMFKWYLLLYN